MDNFENLKFSHYKFSPEEMELMFDENKERISLPNIQYIICIDVFEDNQEVNKILNLNNLLDKIKENPNYSYLNKRLIYVKNEFIDEFNPIILVDKDTWMFVKGIVVGSHINNIL